jgi:hypothetical protein
MPVGAVAVAVLDLLALDERGRGDGAAGEVRVGEVEAGVEYGHADPVAGRGAVLRPDGLQAPGEDLLVDSAARGGRRGDRVHIPFGFDHRDGAGVGGRGGECSYLVGVCGDEGDAGLAHHQALGLPERVGQAVDGGVRRADARDPVEFLGPVVEVVVQQDQVPTGGRVVSRRHAAILVRPVWLRGVTRRGSR